MVWLIVIGGAMVAVAAVGRWLRRREPGVYPSRVSEGEEYHPEPGVHYRRLETPPEEPFD